MSLFSKSDLQKIKLESLKEVLRKGGLSHLRVRITGMDEIIIEGGTEKDIARASALLGGATPKIIKEGRIETTPTIGDVPKISSDPSISPDESDDKH